MASVAVAPAYSSLKGFYRDIHTAEHRLVELSSLPPIYVKSMVWASCTAFAAPAGLTALFEHRSLPLLVPPLLFPLHCDHLWGPSSFLEQSCSEPKVSCRPAWSSPVLHELLRFQAYHEPTAVYIGRGDTNMMKRFWELGLWETARLRLEKRWLYRGRSAVCNWRRGCYRASGEKLSSLVTDNNMRTDGLGLR